MTRIGASGEHSSDQRSPSELWGATEGSLWVDASSAAPQRGWRVHGWGIEGAKPLSNPSPGGLTMVWGRAADSEEEASGAGGAQHGEGHDG